MYASGAYGGGLFPRVGPFAPPSQGAYFAGGALGTGAGIYGGGGGGGHPDLRAMAAGHSDRIRLAGVATAESFKFN
jgi:hypothetical protein